MHELQWGSWTPRRNPAVRIDRKHDSEYIRIREELEAAELAARARNRQAGYNVVPAAIPVKARVT